MLHLSVDEVIATAMEMDTAEGAVFRTITHKLHDPSLPQKAPEVTVAMLATVLKQRLKNADASLGIVVDDLQCKLTANAEILLAAIKEAAHSLSIPLSVIALTMDEMLISLRQAYIERDIAAKSLKDATLAPLPEDVYDRLPDHERRSHDLALKHFRQCKKDTAEAEAHAAEISEKRAALLKESKLLRIDQEIEKEVTEAKEAEEVKKKAPASKKTAAAETPVQVKWEELDPVARFRRTFTVSRSLLDETTFHVIPCDQPLQETSIKIGESLPLPKLASVDTTAPASPEKVQRPTQAQTPQKIDFVVPPPVTRQRIERPPDNRPPRTVKFFRILTEAPKPPPEEKPANAAPATSKADSKKEKAGALPPPPPPKPQDTLVEQTRWVIAPQGSVDLTLNFHSDSTQEISEALTFGIVGSTQEFSLACRTACACPEIVRDPKVLFTRRTRARGEDEKPLAKTFILSKKLFEFGPLLVVQPKKPEGAPKEGGKPAKGAAADDKVLAPVTIVELPNKSNSDKLHFANGGLFAAEVTLCFENEKERTFMVQPDNFTLQVGEKMDVTLLAQPDMVGEVKNAIIACVKDNPEPFRIDIMCVGSRPEVTLDGKKECTLDFGRLLLRRHEEKHVVIKNICALPVKWKVVGSDKLPVEMKLDSVSGVLEVGAEHTMGVAFESERANVFNTAMKVEVTDVDGTATYESLSYTVKGEAHDVVLEWTREIDFKTVRVGEARKESLKLLNKGPYEVQFQFRLPKKLQELLSISPLEGTLRGMSGFKEAAITMVDVVFRSDKEIQIGKKSADLEVVFIEPTLKELAYPPQHIQVRAEALYNKYQIKPMHINFGPCLYKMKKQSTFDIVNTGCFEIKYRLFSLREGLNRALEANTEAPQGAAGKKPQGGKAGTKRDANADASEMVLGAFSVSPAVGIIPIGATQTIAVNILPEGSQHFSELLGIHLEDRDPKDNPEGIPFDLEAESCVPGIIADLSAPESDTIFEEQQIVSRLDGFKKQSGVFGRDEHIFSFGTALSGRRLTERFRLTNPVKVPCTVTASIVPRGDAPDARLSAEAFDIQGSKHDGGKIVIPPLEHRYVTVGFTPNSLNTYSAMFEVNVEGGLDPKTKQLRFELRGEGSLPNLQVDIPPPPAKLQELAAPSEVQGKPTKGKASAAPKDAKKPIEEEKVAPNTLVMPRTIVGEKSSRTITVKNTGDLPATIRFSFPMSTSAGFSFPSPQRGHCTASRRG